MTTTNKKKEKKIIIKEKISIEDNNSYMFEIFNIKNSIERILTKHHFDDTTSISNSSEISMFNIKIFLK